MATYDTWQKRVGIAVETSWGTAVDIDQAIPVTENPEFNLGRSTIESDKLTGVSYNRIDVKERFRGKEAPTVSLSVDVNPAEIVYFLYGLFQRVWEGSSALFTKVYLPYTKSPDFSAKSSSYPFTMSVGLDNRVDNESYNMDGAIVKSLHFESEEGGLVKARIEMVGRNMITTDAAQTGDDYGSFSTASPLLFENANILIGKEGATAGQQANFPIVSASASSVVVSGDQRSYIAEGDYITFAINIGSSNDTLVITEGTSNTATITINQGVYSQFELPLEIEYQLNRNSTLNNTYRMYWDVVSSKFTIERATGSSDFFVDEDNASMEMNGTLGYDGTDNPALTSSTSDNAIPLNAEAYQVTGVSYDSGSDQTTISVTLDQDPTVGTLPQNILIWRKLNFRSFSLDLTNNAVSPLFNNSTVQNHVLGRFFGSGSLVRPWGDISADENDVLNYLASGYRVPIWIYWGGFGKDENDVAIYMNCYYTGDPAERGDVLRELEISFDLIRDKDYSNQLRLPIVFIVADSSNKIWSKEG